MLRGAATAKRYASSLPPVLIVKVKNEDGDLPLAAEGGHPETLEILVGAGADVNATDLAGEPRAVCSAWTKSRQLNQAISSARNRCELLMLGTKSP